jgi:hypothetical protein
MKARSLLQHADCENAPVCGTRSENGFHGDGHARNESKDAPS